MSKLTHNVPKYKKHSPWFRRLMGGWSFLVWLAMIAVTYLCYIHGGSFLPLNGQVLVVKENVAALETARLASVQVVPGQQVKCGDVIAVLDTRMIDLKMAAFEVKWRRDRQEAGLAALDRQRRLLTDAQDLRKTINENEILQERDQSAHAALAERHQTLAALIKKGLVSDNEYFNVSVSLAELEPKLKKYPAVIAQYQRDLADILRMREEMAAAGQSLLANPDEQKLRASIEQEPLMKELRAAKEDHTLRAASDGMVGRINFQQGEIVASGAIVVELIKSVIPAIETFVPEPLTIHVVVGQEFRISTLTAPYQHYRATITSITPQVVGQVDKATSLSERVIRGRRILLTPTGAALLVPGESVMIEAISNSWFGPH